MESIFKLYSNPRCLYATYFPKDDTDIKYFLPPKMDPYSITFFKNTHFFFKIGVLDKYDIILSFQDLQ